MQNACRGFSLPRRKRYARDENIFVSLVTGLDSLDITSETKEQDHMTSKSAFLSCEKILSDFELPQEAGISSFVVLLPCPRSIVAKKCLFRTVTSCYYKPRLKEARF